MATLILKAVHFHFESGFCHTAFILKAATAQIGAFTAFILKDLLNFYQGTTLVLSPLSSLALPLLLQGLEVKMRACIPKKPRQRP